MENEIQTEERAAQPTPAEAPKKGMPKPLLIGLIAGAVATLIAVAVVVYMNLPSTIYTKAKKCLLTGDYNNAITYFTEVIAYEDAEVRIKDAYLGAGTELVKAKDYDAAVEMLDKVEAPERCSEAYLIAGKQLVADGEYTKALEMLAKSTEEETANCTKYANAMLAIDASAFDSAINAFKELGDFENSAELLNSTTYKKAEALYENGSYAAAKTTYGQTTGYDVADKVQNCDLMAAEALYLDGDLKKAKEAFEKLPKDLTFNNVSVSARLATLEEHADALAMCGTFKGNGKMKVRQTHDSTGLWDEWYCDFVDYITIKVVINNDGTYTFKGDADYYIYTNYSSLSAYLKSMEMSETFTKTGKTLPKELVSDSLVKMTYSDGKIKLDFVLKDKNSSVNFTYKYTSSITYTIK